MRILYFSDNVSAHNRRFLEKLTSSGNEVCFISFVDHAPPAGWLPNGAYALRTRATFPRDAGPDQLKQFLPEFRAAVRAVQPDLVHAGPVPTCGYIAALSGFHPLLVASWGSDILLQAATDAQWRCAAEIALRAADGFLCDTTTVRRAAQNIVPISNDRIAQFPWGIRRGLFSPTGLGFTKDSLGFAHDSVVFLCTRSWEPVYQIDVLLEAFYYACRDDERLRLILLGSGSEEARIRDCISRYGLSGRVLAAGVIPASDMPRWFRCADAYISCAESDGTSISLLEAMATGLPVIVADNTSNREWVVDGHNGWLAKSGSPGEFADKILRAANLRSAERGAISDRNQKIVAERADWDKNFPTLLRLYGSLVADLAVSA